MRKLTKVMSVLLVAILLIGTLAACGCNHVDADHNGLCDNCRKPQEVVHDDVNPKDGICDTCQQLIVHDHADTNSDGKCDVCNGMMDHNHVDADHNGKCDIDGCGIAVKVVHEDENGDYKCDVCGSWTVREPNFNVPAEGYNGDPVTITFYHTMGTNLNTVLDMYIEEFNVLYPNITVEWTQVGGYDDVRDQIQTELTVGGGPNIAYCYPDHVAKYNVAQAVTTLDNLIDSQIEVTRADGTTEIIGLTQAQKDDFIQGFYNEGRAFGDGLMYTMPFSKSTEVLYYNKDFFTENNLQIPTHWWCTEACAADCVTSLEYVCKKIKELDPTSIPLGYDSESNWFITMCEQLGTPYTSASGEELFLFDNAENKAFVKRFKEWYNKGWLTTQEIYGAYTSGLFINQDAALPRSYMSIGSSAGATHQRPAALEDGSYPFEVGIASIPQVDPANPKVISQGPSVCIFQKSNPQEVVASWLFVKFLTTSVEFQAAFGLASGYMPVLQSVRNEALAEYDAEGKPANAIAIYIEDLKKADGGANIAQLSTKVALDQAKAYYVSPAFNGSSEARDQVGMLIENIFLLTKTGADLDAEIDRLFAQAIYECYYSIGREVPKK